MKRARFIFTRGLIACAIILPVCFLVPYLYDRFGEGPALIRSKVTSSAEVHRVCGESKIELRVIPWDVHLEDTDSHGELQISYVLNCGPVKSKIDADMWHSMDGNWRFRSLTLRRNAREVPLLVPTSP
jgi:hypothetical protein